MPRMQWISRASVEADREYLALVSYLPLRRYWAIPKFIRYAGAIQQQLRTTAGLMGYSLLAQVFARRFWTLSVWQDDAALAAFVRAMPHAEIMRSLQGEMGKTGFESWRVKGSEIPPPWDDAMKRIEIDAATKR